MLVLPLAPVQTLLWDASLLKPQIFLTSLHQLATTFSSNTFSALFSVVEAWLYPETDLFLNIQISVLFSLNSYSAN